MTGTAPGFGASRGLFGFIGNTLNYIGKNPLQFALSTGMAMACSFAVKAGIVALGVGLGPLGLAMAGAMATSVIMNVGRKLWNGEGISLSDLTGKALFSGALAGLLGGIFGGFFADKMESLGDTLDPDLKPNDTYVPSEHNIDTCETQAVPFATDCSMEPTDEYIYSISDWPEFKAYLDVQGETFQTIDMAGNTTLDEMVRNEADWFVLIDENGNAVEAMHHDAVVEMDQLIEERYAELGIKEPDFVQFTNSPYLHAAVQSVSLEEGSLLAKAYELFTGKDAVNISQYMDINSATLYDKETFDAIITHESHHSVQLQDIDTYEEFKDFTECGDHSIESDADLTVYQDGNYGGALKTFTQGAISEDNAAERLEYALTLNDPDEMRNVLKPLANQISEEELEAIINSDPVDRALIIAELDATNTMDIEADGDPHPSLRNRILETMKYAAADPDLDKAAFQADMQECQDMIDGCDNINFKIDLKSEWAKAQADQTLSELGIGNDNLLSSDHSPNDSHSHGTKASEPALAEAETETTQEDGKSSSFWRDMVTSSQIAVSTRPRG